MRVLLRSGWFYDRFSEMARRLAESARLLEQLFAHPERADQALAELTRLDHEASELRDSIIAEIESVAVTPLPREDVHRVASLLGDTVHRLSQTAHHIRPLHLGPTLPGAAQLSSVLARVAACIATTVDSFRQRDYPTARCDEMEQLNHEGRDVYARAIEDLFAGHPDPMQVLRWKEVYDELEGALEHCRALDHLLDGIVLDNRG